MRMPLVARADALRSLRSALVATRKGASHVVLVTGNPGVGKTRLIDEFRSTAATRSRWLSARGSPLASNMPFGVMTEALEGDLRNRAKQDLLALADARIADLASILPSLRAVGARPDAPSLLGLLEGFLALFSALARSQLVVFALDDLHQADTSTWELVGYLARNPITAPVLVVAALRTEPLIENADLSSTLGAAVKDGLASEIRLEAFGRDDLDALTGAVLGHDRATTELGDWLYGRTRGNPLFAAALLQELLEDPSRRVVPLSVIERVRAILASLPPEAREVIELAAVFGRPFRLADIAPLVQPDTSTALDLLERRGLLESHLEGDVASYDFTHPLVQEAIYDRMGAARRRALHERVARSLVEAPLAIRAYHAARSALPGDEDALRTILAAGREAGANQRHREALIHLQKAIELLPSPPAYDDQRRRICDEIAWHASAAGDHGIGIPALRTLEQLSAGDPATLATVRMRLSSFLSAGVGDLKAAEDQATEAVRLFAAAAPERLPAALNELAWIRGEARSLEEQIEGSRDAYRRADAAGDTQTAMHALGSLGHALAASGALADGIAQLRASRALAVASGDRAQIDWHTGTLADALACSGEIDEAAQLIGGLLEDGTSESDVAHWAAAHVYWWSGDWPRALRACRAVGALNPRPSARSAWTLSLAGLMETYLGEASTASFAQAERAYAGRDFYWFSAHHDWCVGAAALLRGDVAEALMRLRRAVSQMTRIGAAGIEMHVLPDLAVASIAAGEVDEPRRVSQRARAIATTSGLAIADALAHFVEGAVALAAGEEAADHLRRAATSARTLGLPVLASRAFERLSTATTGRERIDALAEAARLYTNLGAADLAHVALGRLRGLDRAGRRAALGVGSLTEREREVIALVRKGLTARQMAERLHVSERTIESHLAHSYSKLGVSGREGLLAAKT